MIVSTQEVLDDRVHRLVLLRGHRFGVGEHRGVEVELALGDLHDALVHGARGYQSVHRDRPRLSQPVAPVLRLPVDLRVEVAVVDDHGVRAGEVKSLPARARGEQKAENLRTPSVKRVANLLPLVHVRAAVQPAKDVTAVSQHPLQNIQDDLPLAEDQRTRSSRLDLVQQLDERRRLCRLGEGGNREAQLGQVSLLPAQLVEVEIAQRSDVRLHLGQRRLVPEHPAPVAHVDDLRHLGVAVSLPDEQRVVRDLSQVHEERLDLGAGQTPPARGSGDPTRG
mmetsp:Transcript_10694/g.41794  ORF Transcript_10694/g.41794 Transcript_10694/m.41794 type:complete len:280 (-) Transcript_10694:1507-2346(-)